MTHSRDANAAINILSRGFEKLGLGQSEDTTPVETALPMFTSSGASDVVDVKRVHQIPRNLMGCQTQSDNVVETGSPTLNEAASAAE